MKTFLTGLLLTFACALGMLAAENARPNIIVVLTDDQGYGDLRCTGNPVLRTPNIDAFHKQSVRFTDFHVSPTCAPTRSALMTGRHELKNGVTHTIYERERMTLQATTLAQAGTDCSTLAAMKVIHGATTQECEQMVTNCVLRG